MRAVQIVAKITWHMRQIALLMRKLHSVAKVDPKKQKELEEAMDNFLKKLEEAMLE